MYHITDDGFWKKNDGHYDRAVFAHGVTSEDLRTAKSLDKLGVSDIEVGNHLYIGSFDMWWLSTPIVSIEEY
jgi:hypothetical protein